MKKEVVTFDIWDTLLKRNFHPEISKLKTIQFLYTLKNKNIKKNYDIYQILKIRNEIEQKLVKQNGECLINDVFKKLLEKILINPKNINELVNELVDKEIKIEIENTYVNEEIYVFLDKYKNYDKYCISDFYMNEKQISKILEAHDLLKYFKKIYVSASFNLTKREDGKLFDKFINDLKINYKDVIHIGDNLYSDIKIPEQKGIKTVYISNKDESDFNINNIKYPDIDFKKINKENAYYNTGLTLSIIAYNFIYAIISKFKQKGANKIFYQTREGETFIKFHKIFEENNPFPFEIPKAELLEVSRVATFGPSLKRFDIENLLRIWSQYRSQSLKTLFKSININYKKYEKYFEKYQLEADELIKEPWFDVRINKLLKDEEFVNSIEEILKENQKRLLKYFETLDVDKNMFIVDIGWRGSIQDNIAHILKNKDIFGFYLALYERYNLEPNNVKKYALLDDLKRNNELVTPLITLLETMFNSSSGSVIGYKNGKSIRQVIDEESYFNKKYIKPIQEGIYDGVKYINEIVKNFPISDKLLKEKTYQTLKKIKEKPSKEILDIYFRNIHNDIFGSGKIVKKESLTFKEKLNIFKVRSVLRNEIWKEGFIKANNLKLLPALITIKGKLRILKNRKKYKRKG